MEATAAGSAASAAAAARLRSSSGSLSAALGASTMRIRRLPPAGSSSSAPSERATITTGMPTATSPMFGGATSSEASTITSAPKPAAAACTALSLKAHCPRRPTAICDAAPATDSGEQACSSPPCRCTASPLTLLNGTTLSA
jgi:hypothetical protein